MENQNQFSGKFGFIAAAAGSAVGLINIWKFPFEVGESGGAAFLLLYLIFCFILCFPIMVAEIALGRSSGKNPGMAFKMLGHKKWTFLGIAFVFVAIIIMSFYIVVSGWSLGYFVEMVKGNFEAGNQFAKRVSNINQTAIYSLVFLVLTGFIVARGINKGIERMSKIMMPLLVILMILLSVYALTLPNARAGVKFYLVPDFNKINLNVVLNALGHAFLSLSLGLGVLTTYGSYLKKNQNIMSSAAMITFADIGISFLAGFMLFPFVFSQGLDTHGGPGLVFMALPDIFGKIGGGLEVLSLDQLSFVYLL